MRQKGIKPSLSCSELRTKKLWLLPNSAVVAEGVLQVDLCAYRLGRLPLRQVLEELKDGDQRQALRGYRQLAASVIQASEHLVIVENPDIIADPHQKVALAERCTGNPGVLFGNRCGSASKAGPRAEAAQTIDFSGK
jgi:hypothetical protein